MRSCNVALLRLTKSISPVAQLQKPQYPAPEPGSFRERVITNQSSYVGPEAWGPRHLHLLDCDILTTDAAGEGSCDTISASVENDIRIAYALDTLLGASGTSSKDAAARALFRPLTPKDRSLFKASLSRASVGTNWLQLSTTFLLRLPARRPNLLSCTLSSVDYQQAAFCVP